MPMTENLHVHRWDPAGEPRLVVLLAHGYGEHAGRYAHVADRLTAEGAVVHAPDHVGHGRSPGERALVQGFETMVSDLGEVADAARAEHPGLPVVLIGHSMGGIIATIYAQRRGDELSALVLSGPVVGGNPDLFGLLQMDPIPEVPIDPGALSRDPAVGEAYAADELIHHGGFARETLQSFVDAVEAIAAGPSLGVPTLWLHGELDPLAPYDATRQAMEHLRGDDFEEKVYPRAMHEIFNETNSDEVIGDAIAFLQSRVAA